MTTLAGMVSGKYVHIAADTLTTSEFERIGTVSKLIIFSEGTEDETCMAVSGSYTAVLAVRAMIEEAEPLHKWDSEVNIYKNLLLIHDDLRNSHGLLVKSEPDEGNRFESSWFEGLIGSRHGLFRFMTTRENVKMKTFGTAGSGADYALGALEALGTDRPEANLKRAIEIASAHDKDTNREVTYWKSPPC